MSGQARRSRGFATRAIHSQGYIPKTDGSPIAPPLHMSTSYIFESADHFAQVIQGERDGLVYTRYSNPTTIALERTVADVESCEEALAFASGMAAIHAAIVWLAGSGERIVSSRAIYGGSYGLMTQILPRLGIQVEFVDIRDLSQVEAALRRPAKLLFVETIGNPTLTVPDIGALCEIARERNVKVLVDNTFATPYLCRPVEFGADLVVHSATKYICGHGDTIAGIVAGRKAEIDGMHGMAHELGGCISPFNAWLLLRGLKTLAVRMDRHCESAMQIAQWLGEHRNVEKVFYPGLLSHPDHCIAKDVLSEFGGMVAFEVKGGLEAGKRFINSLELCIRAASLGDAHTLVSHPASTTHRQFSPEDRQAAGITDSLIRLAVGLEDVDDIIADLEQALATVS